MRTDGRIRAWAAALAMALCVAAPAVLGAGARPPRGETTFELFEAPGGPITGNPDLAADEGGTIWIAIRGKVYYWAGDAFAAPTTGALSADSSFLRGGDGALYATVKGKEAHEGFLYRLSGGKAVLAVTFYYEANYLGPGVYVSKAGRFYNWGKLFLAAYDGRNWRRIEARMSPENTLVFDLGEEVYFYFENALYRADAQGRIEQRPFPAWTPEPAVAGEAVSQLSAPEGVAWGGTRALLRLAGAKPFAFDLRTGERVALPQTAVEIGPYGFDSAVQMRNGDLWLRAYPVAGQGSLIFSVSPDGRVSDVPGAGGLTWSGSGTRQSPAALLETSSGAVVFGQSQGLAVLRDGRQSVWRWERGLPSSIGRLAEDGVGDIWFPLEGKVARMHLRRDPPALVPFAGDWEEIRIAGRMWETRPGELAMFREDRPGVLSRWDGQRWSYQEVPFDTRRMAWPTGLDDRGHVLLCMYDAEDEFYDIGPDSVKRFETAEAMIEAAVADGAHESVGDRYNLKLLSTPDGRVWFGSFLQREVSLLYRGRWERLPFPSVFYYVAPSVEHGAVFVAPGTRTYTYDGEKFVMLPIVRGPRQLMVGERGLMPYERAMIDQRPGRYWPLLMDGSGKATLFSDAGAFERAAQTGEAPASGVPLELGVPVGQRAVPSPEGGAWLYEWGSRAAAARLFAGRIEPIDLSGTPLAYRQVSAAAVDARGDLWLEPGLGSGYVYRYFLSRVRIDADRLPRRSGRTLRLSLSVIPQEARPGVALFTRIDRGEWTPLPEGATECTFTFPISAEYLCEVTGLKYGARIRDDISFRVQADVRRP